MSGLPRGRRPRVPDWVPPAGVVLLACIAYAGSFAGEFVYDDISEIVMNPAMHRLWPPWPAMFVGYNMPARPLPYLTFAVDAFFWGADPFGFHLTNLAVHAAAAACLCDLVRHTLRSPRLHDRFGRHAGLLAFLVAGLWAVHPLGTQAVTYVYQRIESRTALLCLVALLSFARGASSRRPTAWWAGSVAAAAAAMASKETAVVLPLVILAYDWFFVARDRRDLRGRWPYYACLSATWLVLLVHVLVQAGRYQELRKSGHSPLAYALTQPRVVLHYLSLSFWPARQCLDYEWGVATAWPRIIPALTWVLAMLAAVAVGAARRRPWAWVGLCFFLLLAPTSSIMPVDAVVNEHRMYLPLACVVTLVVLAGARLVAAAAARWPAAGRLAGPLAVGLACLAIVAFTAATQARNRLYATPGGVWVEAHLRNPTNVRPLWNLAKRCEELGDLDAAIGYADAALDLNPRIGVYEDLGESRRQAGDVSAAVRLLRQGVATRSRLLGPDDPHTRSLAAALAAVESATGAAAPAD